MKCVFRLLYYQLWWSPLSYLANCFKELTTAHQMLAETYRSGILIYLFLELQREGGRSTKYTHQWELPYCHLYAGHLSRVKLEMCCVPCTLLGSHCEEGKQLVRLHIAGPWVCARGWVHVGVLSSAGAISHTVQLSHFLREELMFLWTLK